MANVMGYRRVPWPPARIIPFLLIFIELYNKFQRLESYHKDFVSKEVQEISSEGGFRNSSIKCDDYIMKDDTVSFSLSRGSFATIVLREIIKPENPLTSGF